MTPAQRQKKYRLNRNELQIETEKTRSKNRAENKTPTQSQQSRNNQRTFRSNMTAELTQIENERLNSVHLNTTHKRQNKITEKQNNLQNKNKIFK